MFPERRRLHQQQTAFNMIAVKETSVIIVTKVGWIWQTTVTDFGGFPRVDAHCLGHFISPFEKIVGPSEAADGWHRRVPEKLVNCSSAQVALDAPVR